MSLLADRLQQAGIVALHLNQSQQRLPCPSCDKGVRDTALALKIDAVGATWLCHRCGFRGASTLGPYVVAFAPRPKEHKPEPVFSEYAARLWGETLELTVNDLAGRYLLGRKCH